MYEVDDAQENYDDIDTCPETIQTKAEVHDGQKTTPESDPAGPQGKEKRDEDYLVPGQDGWANFGLNSNSNQIQFSKVDDSLLPFILIGKKNKKQTKNNPAEIRRRI